MGISIVVTTIGGVVMWFLGFRKARLEINRIRIDTKRIELEVERLTAEKAAREQAQNVFALSERILTLAKERKRQSGTGSAVAFYEQSLCSDLKESAESVNKALLALREKRLTKYSPGGGGTWIFDV
ncbi:MAG: hypothetical protein WBQ08_06820 [Candidatus Sulfotelmatobacter sp.]